jgi:MFS family permease
MPERAPDPTPATSTRVSTIRIPATVWVLGLVSMLMDISSEMIHSLLPVFMVTVLGASATMVGVIEGIAESTALIVKVFSGVLSDFLGRRKWLAVAGYAMGAASKPIFALAPVLGWVFAARFLDRIGKGIRGAPRDALIADVTPAAIRGAAFGLRQSLDTVGAFTGPLVAMALMLLWHNDFRAVFWVAVVPGVLAVMLLAVAVKEPQPAADAGPAKTFPISRTALARMPRAYWWVVAVGALLTLARFSEAFLVLRAQQGGLRLAFIPLVLILMNVVYALAAYPLGALADRWPHRRLLLLGIVPLIAADVVLAHSAATGWVTGGLVLWGVHMAATQGLLAAMVADSAPADMRGTAFGLFNLGSGLAMLVASVIAGVMWDQFGAASTFQTGAGFAVLALILLLWIKSRD